MGFVLREDTRQYLGDSYSTARHRKMRQAWSNNKRGLCVAASGDLQLGIIQ